MPLSIDYLISTQNEKGGWGYSTDHRPTVEPTSLALLAMRGEPGAESYINVGKRWLLSCQNRDGGWGIQEDDDESGWQTAWALIALKQVDQDSEAIARGVEWLSRVGTIGISRESFTETEKIMYDDLGAWVWPWLPGQVCWIEPTALAVLALEGVDQPVVSRRVEAAREYFRKFLTPSGGWDIGNAGPLDTIVLPRAFPTALVLMALAAMAPEDVQKIDISSIHHDLERDVSILSRSAGLLALKILGEQANGLVSDIAQRQGANGSWENNPFYTAWATIALRGSF